MNQLSRSAVLNRFLGGRAALSAILTKLIQGITGPITAVLVLHFFSPDVQGYYYTFSSLLALQIFVELGLSGVIVTFAAHEWAALHLDPSGRVSGDHAAMGRLAMLARQVFRWYLGGAVILILMLLVAGYWFFGIKGNEYGVQWLAPWIALCVLAAASFALTPAWALLTGCGQIAEVNTYRVLETMLRSGVIWVSMALGASLWATVFSLGAVFITGVVFLFWGYRRFFASLLSAPEIGQWSWRHQIAPLQFRIGISWLSGYFAYSMFTPLTFYFLGPVAAGQMGMTWAFTSGLAGLAATWVQVQSPQFAALASQRKFARLDLLAKRTAWLGSSVCFVGAIVGIIALSALETYRPDLAARLLPLGAVAIFMLAELINQLSMVESAYLRAFKREPFLWLSLGTGGVIVLANLILIQPMEGYGAALSYLIGIIVAIIWGTIIFFRCRREWTFPRTSNEKMANSLQR